jgi:hypothetical protein
MLSCSVTASKIATVHAERKRQIRPTPPTWPWDYPAPTTPEWKRTGDSGTNVFPSYRSQNYLQILPSHQPPFQRAAPPRIYSTVALNWLRTHFALAQHRTELPAAIPISFQNLRNWATLSNCSVLHIALAFIWQSLCNWNAIIPNIRHTHKSPLLIQVKYAIKAYGEWMYRSTYSWPRH